MSGERTVCPVLWAYCNFYFSLFHSVADGPAGTRNSESITSFAGPILQLTSMKHKSKIVLLASAVALPALYAASALTETGPATVLHSLLKETAREPVSQPISVAELPATAVKEKMTLEPGYDAMAIQSVSSESVSSVSVQVSELEPSVPAMVQDVVLTLGGEGSLQKVPARRAPGKVVEGDFVSKDISYNGQKLGALVKVESYAASSDTVIVGNLFEWGRGAKVKMAVNASEGTVSIPQQTLEKNQNYGNIDVVAITVSADGKFSIPQDRTIRGTINDKGEVTLGHWAVVALDEASKTVKATFNIFESSQWAVPNATIGGVDMESKSPVSYPMLIEQAGANEAIVYHMLNGLTATLSARLSPAGKVMLSPQQVALHSLYGAFYIYGINSANGKPETVNPIVVVPAADGSLSFSGYFIADQESASMVMSGMTDVRITGSYNIDFPVAEDVNFKGSGTSGDPWQISSYKDLTALSQSVEAGNSYTGKYFALTTDLDLSAVPVTEYIPIGNATDQFAGTFDGCGHFIKGLRIDGKGFPYIGIFGYIGSAATVKNIVVDNFMAVGSGSEIGCVAGRCEGVIEHVEVRNSVLQTSGLLTGGICGALLTGKVSDSSFHGSLSGVGSVAGIAGQASESDIIGCTVRTIARMEGFISSKARDLGGIAGVFSRGTMKDCMVCGTLSDTYGRSATGGLAGRLLSGGTISNCMNTAAISGKRLDSTTSSYAGGLFGLSVSAVVDDCLSAGTIIMSGENNNVGGLAGQLAIAYTHSGNNVSMSQQSFFTNCYYSGQISSSSDSGSKGLYGYAFHEEGYPDLPEDVCFINCFFDQQINKFESVKFGRLTSAVTGKLPSGFSSDKWKVASGKYPVLKTFADTQAGALASVPVILRAGHTAAKVKQSFALGSAPDVVWSLDGEIGNTESESLVITGSAVTVKDKYDSAIVGATTADGLGLKIYVLEIVPKVFDGDGTETSPYLLKTPSDFVTLNSAITTHRQPHAGDFFRMTADIDFSDNTSFKGFGYGTLLNTGFGGDFDGDGHSIHNLNLDMATYTASGDFNPECPNGYNGLFNQLNPTGRVRNLIIAADCSFDFNIFSGSIIGFNRGRLENCRNYADVKGHSRQIGGLVGVNYSGVISKCYNAGRVVTGAQVAGGIAAYNFDKAEIRQCQNDGDISAEKTAPYNEKSDHSSVGGITSDNYGVVEDCVNLGQVTGQSVVGGIAAYTVASYLTADPSNPMVGISHECPGVVRRCVSVGQVNCLGSVATRGAVIGQRNSSKDISGNIYDGSINLIGGMQSTDVEGTVPCSTSELTAGKLIEPLNPDLFDFKAGAYPVLKAFAQEEAAKALRSIYMNFGRGQIRTNVLESVPLSQADGLSWKLKVGDGFSISGQTLNVQVPTGTTILADTLLANLGGRYSKTYVLNSVPVIFNGAGTEADPYRIDSKADWKKLADFVESTGWEYTNSHFILTRDLDFEGDSIRIVGHSGIRFQGDFNGNGKTLSNFIYDNPNGFDTSIPKNPNNPNKFVAKGTGLFGAVGNAGKVRNLTINGIVRGHSEIGGIAGSVYGLVENCVNKGLVGTNSSTAVGGIAYRLYDGGIIRGCVNMGRVLPDNGSGAGQTGGAGIVYFTNAASLVENCRNLGEVGHKDKSFFAGIAYSCMGDIKGCVNEKTLIGNSNLYGVVYSLGMNAIMENCSNTADFDLGNLASGGANIYGLFNTSAAGGTGYIKGCFNTGNITAVNYCAGLGNTSNTPMIDCWNSGDIVSLKNRAVGVVSTLGATTDQRNVSSGLYNTGKIVSRYSQTAGVVNELKEYATLLDSYNLGEVRQEHNGLCCAGVVANGNGRIERCFNAGDVYSWGHCTGGVAGRPGTDKADFETGVFDCFNIGSVTVESRHSGTRLYGAAGGVIGSPLNGQLTIARCHNAGEVRLRNTSCANEAIWAGGIIGGVLNANTAVRDCYNAGRVVKLDPADKSLFTAFAIGTPDPKLYVKPDSVPFDINMTRIYYDASVCPGADDRHIEGSDLRSSQMAKIELEGFSASSHGGYPVNIAYTAGHAAVGVSTAMLLLDGENTETHDAILNRFAMLAPAGYEWKEELQADGQPRLWLSGGFGYPLASGSTTLLCTSPDGHVRAFPITVGSDFNRDGVDDLSVKTIENVTYTDLQGRSVMWPEAGQVYIVRTRFTDGTVTVSKMMARD